jgi:hypothetical protein
MLEINNDWVIVETNTSNFNDKRLDKRYKKLLGNFASSPNKSIPGTFKSWGETLSAYRFFNNKEFTQGFYIHPSMAITPDKQCLGIIDFQSWTREELGSRYTRKNRSIEEKESYRWIKSYEAANQVAVAAPETKIISIADREGEFMSY